MSNGLVQNLVVQSGRFAEEEKFWLEKLAGKEWTIPSFPVLPATGEPAELPWELDAEVSQALIRMSNGSDFALYTILVSCASTVLWKYGAPDEMLLPAAVFRKDYEPGLLNTMLLIPVSYSRCSTMKDVLMRARQSILEIQKNQNYPVQKILEKTAYTGSLESSLAIVLENIQNPSYVEGCGAALVLKSSGERISGKLLLSKASPLGWGFIGHLSQVLRKFIESPSSELASVDILTGKERSELLEKFDNTGVEYPQELTITDLFDRAVSCFPARTALVFDGKELSYAELNAEAQRIAAELIHQGVKGDDIVAVLVDRGPFMIIALLGILKSGAAYLPLDVSYPADRIAFMLSDSGAEILLTDRRHTGTVDFPGRKLLLDGTGAEHSYVKPIIQPSSLAYVIYTSGSTGLPKGVLVEHRNVVRLLFNEKPLFRFDETDVWTLFHSYCFDFSVWEMYGALLNGGKLVIVPKDIAADGVRFHRLLRDHQVTVLNQTPTAFYNLSAVDSLSDVRLSSLRQVIFGGEALKPALLAQWSSRYPSVKLVNMYGITETTVHVTYKEITAHEISAGASTIGTPIATLSFYILNRDKQLQAIGSTGEIYVGGDGVARGYLNRETLTAERFINSPFQDGLRLYKTGDLARYLPGGDVEYIGRGDQQVKIRGFRVEPGEIENLLMKEGGYSKALVLPLEREGDVQLMAFVIGSRPDHVTDIKERLSAGLPDYMIPARIIPVQEFPLTGNGKIDTKALSALAFSFSSLEEPSTDTEKRLASIWKEVLKLEAVGSTDNFFEIGGHSLRATQMLAHVHREFGLDIPLKEVFRHPVIRELAQIIDSSAPSREQDIRPAAPAEHYRLSHAQKRMWLLCQSGAAAAAYHIPGVYVFNSPVDVKALSQAFRMLVGRHESLRTSFRTVEGVPVQKIHENAGFEIVFEDRSSVATDPESMKQIISREIHAPFDLHTAPLMRARLVKLHAEKFIFILNLHHIVSDGWSLEVLVSEVLHSYSMFSSGHEPQLAPLSVQYKDYADWQNRLLEGAGGEKLRQYWISKLKDYSRPASLTPDHERVGDFSYKGGVLSFPVEAELVNKLYRFSRDNNSSLFIAFLAVVKVLLSKIAQRNDIVVGTPVAGRDHHDLQGQVGFYVNTLVLSDSVSSDESFLEVLDKVRNTVLEAFENQAYPFDRLVEDLQVKRETGKNPLFDILVTYEELNSRQAAKNDLRVSYTDELLKASEDLFKTSKFDLAFGFRKLDEEAELILVYNSDLYREPRMRLLASNFNTLLHGITERPSSPLSGIPCSTGRERELFESLDLDPAEYEAAAPLTASQRDICLTCVFNPESPAMRLTSYFMYPKAVDPVVFREALQLFTDHHTALRSSVLVRNQEPYQVVRRHVKVHLECLDISGEYAGNNLEMLIRKHTTISQSLDNPPAKFFLLKVSSDRFLFVQSINHLFTDGYSKKILFEKVDAIYHQIMAGERPHPETLDYLDYVGKYRGYYDTPELEQKLRALASKAGPLQYKAAVGTGEEQQSASFTIAEDRYASLKKYCHDRKIPEHIFFRAAYALAVKAVCGATADVFLREPVHGRSRAFYSYIGCFSCSLPVLIPFSDPAIRSFEDLCRGIAAQAADRKAFQYASLGFQNRVLGEEKLTFFYNYQKFWNLNMHDGVLPFFQVYNVLDNQLELRVEEHSMHFVLKIDFKESLFNGKGFMDMLESLVIQVLAGKEELACMELLLPADRQVLEHANNTERVFPADAMVPGLIARMAAEKPDAVAVVSGEAQLSYAALMKRSGSISRYLVHQEIGQGHKVAVVAARTEWMVAGALSVMLSGAAFIPVDSSLPAERIRFILEDSGASAVLVEGRTGIPDPGCRIICVDDIPEIPYIPSEINISADSPAYVIYTSGTTGVPKGVAVSHRNLLNAAFAWKELYGLEAAVPNIFQVAGFSFDVFTGDLVRALTNGGKLVICPDDVRLQPSVLYGLLVSHRITIFESTPALIVPLMEYIHAGKHPLEHLRTLITGSDICPVTHFNTLMERFGPGIRIFNSYGVTEATIDSSCYVPENALPGCINHVPIGKPMANMRFYILDEHSRPVPVGVPGELYIGGEGVAMGYLNREELNSQRFLHLPALDPAVLYRTGDLARWLPDGNVEFFGRNDFQLKIRGFRIEAGEIENVLDSHPAVERSLVTARDIHGEKELSAYLICNAPVELAQLKSWISEKLPYYMIPAYFIRVDAFPLSMNGKVDRHRLPDPMRHAMGAAVFEAPVNEMESQVSEIWKQVLKRDDIGVSENFFDAGGSSMRLVTLHAALEARFPGRLSIADLFKYNTIRAIAGLLGAEQSPEALSGIEI